MNILHVVPIPETPKSKVSGPNPLEARDVSSRKVKPNRIIRWKQGFSHKGKAAFSLIEIVLALGIVAFGLISVVGLMPIGLTTLRNTIETSVSTQIAQVLINEVQQTDYNSLPPSQMFYFDEQGNLLNSAANPLKLYDVRLEVTKGTTIPGSLGTSSANLATLSITISPDGGQPVRTISALVARSAN